MHSIKKLKILQFHMAKTVILLVFLWTEVSKHLLLQVPKSFSLLCILKNGIALQSNRLYYLVKNDHLQQSTLCEINRNYSTKLMPVNDILSISCYQNLNIHQISWVYNKANIPCYFRWIWNFLSFHVILLISYR